MNDSYSTHFDGLQLKVSLESIVLRLIYSSMCFWKEMTYYYKYLIRDYSTVAVELIQKKQPLPSMRLQTPKQT